MENFIKNLTFDEEGYAVAYSEEIISLMKKNSEKEIAKRKREKERREHRNSARRKAVSEFLIKVSLITMAILISGVMICYDDIPWMYMVIPAECFFVFFFSEYGVVPIGSIISKYILQKDSCLSKKN